MAKTIIWTETEGFYNAFVGDKQVGCYYRSIENDDRYYWVSGSKNGFESSTVEAMKAIEKVVNG